MEPQPELQGNGHASFAYHSKPPLLHSPHIQRDMVTEVGPSQKQPHPPAHPPHRAHAATHHTYLKSFHPNTNSHFPIQIQGAPDKAAIHAEFERMRTQLREKEMYLVKLKHENMALKQVGKIIGKVVKVN
jgi:hypothetical protein